MEFKTRVVIFKIEVVRESTLVCPDWAAAEGSVEPVQDRLFDSEVVIIDGRAFLHCQLINCELQYSGGPFTMTDTLVSGCQWAFGGAARRTMEVLTKFDVLDNEERGIEPAVESWMAPLVN